MVSKVGGQSAKEDRMRLVPLILIGHGGVGKALLKQIDAYAERHGAEAPIRFLQAAVITSRRVSRHAAIDAGRDPGDWDGVARIAREAEILWSAPPIIVDATAAECGDAHLRWVDEGFTVVTANKRPLNGSLDAFHRLTGAIDRRGHRSYWFEATVGAGLPVVRTIREHVETGDRIVRIDAVLSGTLNFLCDAHARGEPFGASVLAAVAKGLAEPDPRQDLACEDVARKAMILGRLAGMRLDGTQALKIVPLLTGDALSVDRETFLASLARWKDWPTGWPAAGAHEYVVSVLPQEGIVLGRLKQRKRNRPPLVGAENRFAITTERASDPPILIRGPGAGRDVTATALFGDLLRSIARL
jgi:homoserine dehydrogenase